MTPTFSVCVYCGSKPGASPDFATTARAVGHWIGARGGQLVYGGGKNGLMGIVAAATLEAGGRVVGVIPKALVEKEWANNDCSELHIVDTMHERKRLMAEHAQTAVSFSSPVRMRTTRSTAVMKILPSPILPVRAADTMASTQRSTSSLFTTTSTFTLGRNRPRIRAAVKLGVALLAAKTLDFGDGQPGDAASASASRTSSSLKGLMTAVICFMVLFLLQVQIKRELRW
jgi:hypothetical protein